MKSSLVVIVVALSVLLSGVAGCAEEQEVPGNAMRVGTFNTRAVAVAWGRSDTFMEWVADLRKRADAAESAGDDELLAALEAEGSGQQDRMHRQVFGDDPIDDILEKMEGALPGIAGKAGVDLITNDLIYHGSSVEVVDITEHMVAHFDPTEETLETIEALLKTEPVDLDEMNADE